MSKRVEKGESMSELKSIKQLAKEAMHRLKSGFWQRYDLTLEEELRKAELVGVSTEKVKDYYAMVVTESIRSDTNEKEAFYQKVKAILDEEGEISNVIGRLTDKDEYEKLSYEEKQRYNMELSDKYLQALERYNKEKAVTF